MTKLTDIMKEFTKDLEVGDLSSYRITKLVICSACNGNGYEVWGAPCCKCNGAKVISISVNEPNF